MQQVNPSQVAKARTKNCPMCGEEILMSAKKCKHCNEYLSADAKKPAQPAGGRFVALAVASGIVLLLIIAGLLAYPFINQARVNANERAAIDRLFKINHAENQFFEVAGRSGTLKELFDKGLIDSPEDERNGYRFYVGLHDFSIMFDVSAKPISYGSTGIRSFYTSGLAVHAADKHGAAADENDPHI